MLMCLYLNAAAGLGCSNSQGAGLKDSHTYKWFAEGAGQQQWQQNPLALPDWGRKLP